MDSRLKGLLALVAAAGMGFVAAAADFPEYVPVEWPGVSQEGQVSTIRRLHDAYGFRRFALVAPFRREMPTASDISASFAREVRTRFICNASDLEMCDFEGKTYLNYAVGDQHGFYYICEAWYDGPMGELLENFFK